jgi:hypothetical protein
LQAKLVLPRGRFCPPDRRRDGRQTVLSSQVICPTGDRRAQAKGLSNRSSLAAHEWK